MPRGLSEPAHTNKHPQRAHSSIRITLCTLPPPPHFAHHPTTATSRKAAGYREHTAPSTPPPGPFLPQTQANLVDPGQRLSSIPRRKRRGQGCAMASKPQIKHNQLPLLLLTLHSWWSYGIGRMKTAPLYQLLVPTILDPFNTSCVILK